MKHILILQINLQSYYKILKFLLIKLFSFLLFILKIPYYKILSKKIILINNHIKLNYEPLTNTILIFQKKLLPIYVNQK
jgi:hypothetical protein